MEDKKYCVYCHTNKINGKKYIGITCQPVKRRWKNGYGYRDNSYFFRSIEKYGWDSFEHDILFESLSRQDACELEQRLIAEHNTIAPNGYNFSLGGESYNTSDITRLKLRKANIGKKQSKETIAKRVAKMSGENHPMYGKHHTDETKHKISESKRGKVALDNCDAVICEGREFISIEDCAKFYNVDSESVRMWLLGKTPLPPKWSVRGLRYRDKETHIIYSDKGVYCVETQQIFNTFNEASRYFNTTPYYIKQACNSADISMEKFGYTLKFFKERR